MPPRSRATRRPQDPEGRRQVGAGADGETPRRACGCGYCQVDGSGVPFGRCFTTTQCQVHARPWKSLRCENRENRRVAGDGVAWRADSGKNRRAWRGVVVAAWGESRAALPSVVSQGLNNIGYGRLESTGAKIHGSTDEPSGVTSDGDCAALLISSGRTGMAHWCLRAANFAALGAALAGCDLERGATASPNTAGVADGPRRCRRPIQ